MKDHTMMAMQANQMFTKQRLETVVYKRSGLLNSVKSTKSMFDTVMKLGIPSFFDGDGYLYDLDKYEEKLMDKQNDYDVFKELDSVKGKGIVHLLPDDFEILIRLKLRDMPPLDYEQLTNMGTKIIWLKSQNVKAGSICALKIHG